MQSSPLLPLPLPFPEIAHLFRIKLVKLCPLPYPSYYTAITNYGSMCLII